VYFVVHKTGRLCRLALSGGRARPITPAFGKAASPVVSPDGRWVVYVHQDDDEIDRLAVVDAAGSHWPQVLASGRDFYMQPAWSPDGTRLAWIAWDQPQMPWDGSLLCSARVELGDGILPRLGEVEVLAGGPEVAVQQPEFAPDGRHLLFISDETGWGRIAVMDLRTRDRRWITPEGIDYGPPAWVQGMRSYAIAHDGRQVVAAGSRLGRHVLSRIDLVTGETSAIEPLAEYHEVAQIATSPHAGRFVFVGSGPSLPPRVVEHDLESGATRVVARASAEVVLPEALAHCEAVSWRSSDGEEVHGLFYAPASDRFVGVGKPPLVVLVHGGPTSQARAGWNSQVQFFATRGYAVLLVNYRGSTGYGRPYMLKLRGNWGRYDVEDCVAAVSHFAAAGRIDPSRTVIMGGSAGGFTVLQTMIDHPEAFTAGVCLYGVANQFHLASQTHKFEARYLDSLLGPLPEAAPRYRQRSPVLHADRIRRPIAIFQGDLDRVVPREQSDAIVEALRRNRTPHPYHVYEGEGHGWRKRETIEHFYRTVESFLRQYVLFA
jgi:dipeptidyl aminopeptidase/acylaminoacyl peptidase